MSVKRTKRFTLLPGIQIEDGGKPIGGIGPNWEKEIEAGLDPAKLNKKIAVSFERRIKEVTGISLDYGPAVIGKIEFGEDQLVISVRLPFLLPPLRSPERRELERLRDEFARHVMQENNERRLSNLLYEILVQSLLKPYRKNWHSSILKHLKGIPQRSLAGRSGHPIPQQIRSSVAAEGQLVWKAIIAIQSDVKSWNSQRKRLKDSTIAKKLRKIYPTKQSPWIEYFLALNGKLPRRRNSTTGEVVADLSGNLPPCTLSEPENWSTLGAAVRTIQNKLIEETNTKYSLLEIKSLVKPKSSARLHQ
jgi:hypothetical protein